MTNKKSSPTEKKIREIKRQTRKRYSAEEKIRIVLEGLRGDESIAELNLELRRQKKADLHRVNYNDMRRSASEKMEIIRIVNDSELGVTRTLRSIKARFTNGITGTLKKASMAYSLNLQIEKTIGTRFLSLTVRV